MASQQAQNLMRGPSITPGANRYTGIAGNMLERFGTLNPALQGALGQYQQLSNLGFSDGGLNTAAFMNPFEQQVIGGVQGDFDRQRMLATNAANQQATGQGAFGGSRQAVLQANLTGDINRNESQQLANLRYGGFQNAQQMAANLGLAGLQGTTGLGQYQTGLQGQQIQGLLGLGDYLRNIQQQQMLDPYTRAQMGLGLMGGGLGYGGSTNTQITPTSTNVLGSTAGGAMTGGAIGGPPGAVIGGGIGLLSGLLG